MLRSAWFIARKDLAAMLRARETLLWVFLMPPIFFYFIGTVTGGFGPPGAGDAPDPLALSGVDEEGDLLVGELVRRLERENYQVVREETGAEPSAPRLVLPRIESHRSFTEGVLAGERAKLTLQHEEEELGTQFDRMRVAKAVYGVLADLLVFAEEGERRPERASPGSPRRRARSSSTSGRLASAGRFRPDSSRRFLGR